MSLPVPQPLSDEQRALQFFSLEGLGAACTASSFDQQELIEKTIGHIRDADPNISLRGISQFWKMTRDTLTVSGALTTLSASQESPDGNRITASTTRLLSSLSRPLDHSTLPRARPVIRPALSSLSGGPLPLPNPAANAGHLPARQDAPPPQPIPPAVP